MYNSRFIVNHSFPCGVQNVRGTLCDVHKGEMLCDSVKIQKALARSLSVQFGKCTYEWKNERASGSVTYCNGEKKAETFLNG